MKNISSLLKRTFAFVIITLVSFTFLSEALAVPPPLSVEELCKNSDMVVLGKYVGGMVSKPEGCEFWVTFQVKPEKYYKKPANAGELKVLQFKKRYFIDNDKCQNIPGPNAMPDQMAVDLKKPKDDKKIFFLKEKQGQLWSLTSVFWAIVEWKQAPKKWHEEFKNTPACHGK